MLTRSRVQHFRYVSRVWLTIWVVDRMRISQTIAEGKSITGDLGGKASTKEYTSAIIEKLSKA